MFHECLCSAFGMAVLLLAVRAPLATASTADCGSTTVHVDLSEQEGTITSILGGSVGQTFMAVDTLIKSISVWKRQWPCNCTSPMKLWVTRTDSTGNYPEIYSRGDIIQEGPVARVFGDSVTLAPVKVQYLFDPPLRLPHPGRYAFFVQDYCSVGFDAYVNKTDNIYTDGRLYRTSRTRLAGCRIDGLYGLFYDMYDMIFEVEFCPEATTPIRRSTWGRLKVIYR